MRIYLIVSFLLLLNFKGLQAACTSPAGVQGQMQYISGEYKYCDNTNWLSMTVSNLGTSCSNPGLWQRSGSDSIFCNGSTWISMVGTLDDGTCSNAGAIEYDLLNLRMRWCSGTNWKIMQPSVAFAPPSNLMLSIISNERTGTATWTQGTVAGMCRLQYYKNETTWVNLDANIYDCNSDGLVFVNLPTISFWTNNYDATGIKLRLVSSVSGDSFGEFPQRARCLPKADLGYSTPNTDENCNGVWDDEPTGLDACIGTPGAPCTGGAIYLGKHDGNFLMTTPGGCTNSATPTCAGGTDGVMRKWGTYGNWTGHTDTLNGKLQSGYLAANDAGAEAAKYCENMTFGGYSDWYLPAVDELALMSTSKVSLSGLRGTTYWSSTELSNYSAYYYNFSSDDQNTTTKNTNVYVRCVRSQAAPDPCDYPGVPLGTTCNKNIQYAGVFDNNKYFITPGGCSETIPVTCSGGNDTLTKIWRGSYSSNHNVTAVTNITAATGKSVQQGDETTSLISAAFTGLGAHDTAAQYCQNLVYEGHNDWYLPSKSELAYIYCHMDVGSHNTSYPNENPNCTSYGGKTSELTGFPKTGTPYYWSSSKSSNSNSWRMLATTGLQNNIAQSASAFVRCIRKESGPSPVAPTGLSLTQPQANSSVVTVSWTKGSGNGGAGGCKIQYLKDGVTWTDAADVSALTGTGALNCDVTGSTQIALSYNDNWTNTFNSTGVSVRLVNKKYGTVYGTFAQKVVCNPMAGSVESTPGVDENCNGVWDENVGGVTSCPAAQSCVGLSFYADGGCAQKFGADKGNCVANADIAALGNTCLPFFVGSGFYVKYTPSFSCFSGGLFY